VLRRGIDLFVAIEDRYTEEAMRRLVPVEAGESGAAGVAGLLALMREPAFRDAALRLGLGPSTTALLVNTEGATDPDGYRRVIGAAPALYPR